MDIGKRIRKLREQRGIEQLELAKALHIPQSKMNKIESGYQKRIEPDLLVELSKVLNVTVDYLVGSSNETNISKVEDITYFKKKIAEEFPDIDLMFKDMESLTAEDMKEVYEYIKFKKSQKK